MIWGLPALFGAVPKWPKGAVLKTARGESQQRFKSSLLRHDGVERHAIYMRG